MLFYLMIEKKGGGNKWSTYMRPEYDKGISGGTLERKFMQNYKWYYHFCVKWIGIKIVYNEYFIHDKIKKLW